jgi:hypothetical protein
VTVNVYVVGRWLFIPASLVKPDGCVSFVQFSFGVLIGMFFCSLFGNYTFNINGSLHRSMIQYKQPTICNLVTEFIIPPFIKGSTFFECELQFPLRLDYGRSPHAYVNQRLQIQLELLMMSGVPLETC